ncbi:hypothetical protein [Halorarum salinum]|uniref:Uncharacterized protein n=1 Tax=Halorarum salinum TaxID=2743089 RepID=A0A7D5Q9U0_9EURY|nr:hypothetical protein [Halobaculum salinum]QLG61897.1 hypothetical protein HUG12_09260 [Halobaculum salinum]
MKNIGIVPVVKNRGISPVVLAIAGFAAIVVGIHQGVLHVAPGYQGTINAGGEVPGRREWLLAGMGIIGIVGAAVAPWRKRLSVVPVAVGGIVLFEAFRTMFVAANGLRYPLYTETTYPFSGEPIMFIFGAEPFLLVAGGGFLVGAGIVGLRGRRTRENRDEMSSPSSRAT